MVLNDALIELLSKLSTVAAVLLLARAIEGSSAWWAPLLPFAALLVLITLKHAVPLAWWWWKLERARRRPR